MGKLHWLAVPDRLSLLTEGYLSGRGQIGTAHGSRRRLSISREVTQDVPKNHYNQSPTFRN